MSPTPGSPLTQDHLAQLKNALDQVQQAKIQIDLAKRAGIPIGNLEELNNQNETQLRQIKQVYFGGQ